MLYSSSGPRPLVSVQYSEGSGLEGRGQNGSEQAGVPRLISGREQAQQHGCMPHAAGQEAGLCVQASQDNGPRRLGPGSRGCGRPPTESVF